MAPMAGSIGPEPSEKWEDSSQLWQLPRPDGTPLRSIHRANPAGPERSYSMTRNTPLSPLLALPRSLSPAAHRHR